MLWSTWAAPISTSQCLTPEGRQVAEWAVGVLQSFLGDDFPQRALDAGQGHALVSPSLTASLWPLVEARHVYFSLYRLAVQLTLLADRSRPLQKLLRNVANPPDWTHGLIQLEVAAQALRDGWHTTFEALQNPTYPVDVRLEKGADTLQLEITAVGMADSEWVADQYFHRVHMTVLALRVRHGVYITGFVGDPAPDDVTVQWLQEIEDAAGATAQDRRDRWVSGGVDGNARMSVEEPKPGEPLLEAATVTTDAWGRLDLRIERKANKTANAGPVCLWLEEHAGLFMFTQLANMSLAERLAALGPLLRAALEPHAHLAGIILTPGRMWAPGTMHDETCEIPGFDGVDALRRLLPPGHVREAYIVGRSGSADGDVAAFREWLGREATWLDWAFEQLRKAPIDTLVHEPLAITG